MSVGRRQVTVVISNTHDFADNKNHRHLRITFRLLQMPPNTIYAHLCLEIIVVIQSAKTSVFNVLIKKHVYY